MTILNYSKNSLVFALDDANINNYFAYNYFLSSMNVIRYFRIIEKSIYDSKSYITPKIKEMLEEEKLKKYMPRKPLTSGETFYRCNHTTRGRTTKSKYWKNKFMAYMETLQYTPYSSRHKKRSFQ